MFAQTLRILSVYFVPFDVAFLSSESPFVFEFNRFLDEKGVLVCRSVNACLESKIIVDDKQR